MLVAQERYDKEVSAYLVNGKNGREILILPWAGNSRTSSDRWIGYHRGTKTITDFDNNKYEVLRHIHTHPDEEYRPSEDDIYNTNLQGIPGVVLSNKSYTLINSNLLPERHLPTGSTRNLINGYSSESLFRFIK